MKKIFIPVVAALVTLTACSPKLLKHYNTKPDNLGTGTQLELSVFSTAVKAGSSTAPVFQLTERAQAELVKAIDGRMPKESAAALVAALIDVPEDPVAECAFADKTVFSKQLQITLLGNLDFPADRVDKLTVRLNIVDRDSFQFLSWDRFDSVYLSYNFGTATYTQTNKLNFDAGLASTSNKADDKGSIARDLGISAEHSNSLSESVSYASRRLTIGGALAPYQATLVQEGGPNISLFGTSTAKISLRMTPTVQNNPVYKLTYPDGDKTAQDKVGVLRCQAKVLATAAPLALEVWATAVVRKVVERDDTITESDDAAQYIPVHLPMQLRDDRIQSNSQHSSITKQPVLPLTLLSEADTTFRRFGVCLKGATPDDCDPVVIESSDGAAGNFDVLYFATTAEANNFRLWLLSQQPKSKVVAKVGNRLIAMKSTLRAPDTDLIARLQVDRLKSNNVCEQPPKDTEAARVCTARRNAETAALSSKRKAFLDAADAAASAASLRSP